MRAMRATTRAPRRARGIGLVLVACAMVGSTAPARADGDGDGDGDGDAKRACVSTHERTQRARLAGKLVDARNEAIACAQDRCPALVRSECARLLAEIEAAVPSVVFEVRDERGARVPAVVVAVDGVLVPEAAEGRPVALDPGRRKVRVSTADGRAVEEELVLFEGDARRHVTVTLAGKPVPDQAEAATGADSAPPPAASQIVVGPPALAAPARSAVPWPVYALGVVGVVGLGTFVGFGLRGYREEVALESSCAPACAPGSDDAMRRDYLVADVALATGVAALAAAAVLYFTHRASDAKPRVAGSASPGPSR